MSPSPTTSKMINQDFYPQKAHLDLKSLKLQMVLGLTLVFAVCWLIYPSPYFFWVFLNALLISCLVLEITGCSGNRLGVAVPIWSALLMVVNPITFDAIRTFSSNNLSDLISGLYYFGSLLGALLYVGSLFLFLRYRLLNENYYLWGSFVCFMLCLFYDFSGVTLPLIASASWLLPATKVPSFNKRNALQCCLSMWVTAIGMIAWYTYKTNYSMGELITLLLHTYKVSLAQEPLIIVAYGLIASLIAVRIFIKSISWPSFSWMVLFTILSQMNPFLFAGSSSALICLSAIPAIDKLNSRQVSILTIFGLIALVALFLVNATRILIGH